jgi:hypothetical protein
MYQASLETIALRAPPAPEYHEQSSLRLRKRQSKFRCQGDPTAPTPAKFAFTKDFPQFT